MTAAPPLEERPVTSLRGVGAALAETLERLGLRTVQDVLFHLPLRYEDRTRVVPIGTLRAGDRAVVEGEVQLAEVVFRRRRALLCRIADGSGFLTLRFFHFSARAAGGARARRAPALLRRGAARPGRPRDRPSRVPQDRARRAVGAPRRASRPCTRPPRACSRDGCGCSPALALAQLPGGGLRDWVTPEVLGTVGLPSLEAALALRAPAAARTPTSRR